MSFLKQLLEFTLTDFNENELKVIEMYFIPFLKRLSENNSTLVFMNIITRPDQDFSDESLREGFNTLKKKGLTSKESLFPKVYLYYEAFINKTSKYSDHICVFLEYFKKHGQKILGSNLYYDRAFMEHFNNILNDEEIIFLLFLLNDLNFIELSWLPPDPDPDVTYIDLREYEGLYEYLKVNKIMENAHNFLGNDCIVKRYNNLIYYIKELIDFYLKEDYIGVHLKILASAFDNDKKKWLINYIRIDFISEELNGFPKETYSTDNKAILFQNIIELDELLPKFSKNGFIYESNEQYFYFNENLSIPTNYGDFKKKFNTNHYQYNYVQCGDGINLIFQDSLYNPNIDSYYQDVINKYYFYNGIRLDGLTLFKRVIGYSVPMDSVPVPLLLIIFPVKSFDLTINKKIEDLQPYLEINWDINEKLRDFIYITYKKGKDDSIVIYNNSELIKVEQNFSGIIQFGIYWSGTDDLLQEGCTLFTKEISYLKDYKKKEIKTEDKKYKVFISSTIQDDKKVLRTNIKENLESKKYIRPILSEFPETFPKPIDPSLNTFEASIAPIKNCQIFVLIVGKRYGNIEPGKDISIMEAEYDEAVRNHLPHIIFIDEEVIQDYDRYSTKDSGWDGKKIKSFRLSYIDLLKIKGYDEPAKNMKFIAKLSKLKLTYSKKHKDNWYWSFNMNNTTKFLKALESQIDFYINQLEPSVEEMMNTLIQFSTTDIPETRRDISERFISWGSVGTQFLLDEHRTNNYGYSDVSGAVMDMSYPNWQKKEQYSTVIQYNQQIPVERTVSFLDQYREEKEEKIKRDQETYETVEGFILAQYQRLYFQKCLELSELDEEEEKKYQILYSKSENDHDLYKTKVFNRADTLRNHFHLHLNKSKQTFYDKETGIEISEDGEIISSEVTPVEMSGVLYEEKLIDEINKLLMSLRNYWNSQNQEKVGKPEIKKIIDFEKELGSELRTLKLKKGFWSFKK